MKMKTRKLKTILNAVASQNDECTVRSTDDGWSIKTVDPSHVSMISISVPKGAFTDYVRTDDFALSLKNVLKMLSKAGEDTEFFIDNGKFVVESDGLKSKFPLIAPSENDPRIPELQYDSGAMLEVGLISKLSSSVFGSVEAYEVSIKDDVLTIAAEDESGSGVVLSITKDQCLDLKGAACSHFPIDMLDRFIKVLGNDTVIDMRVGNDIPLTVSVDDADVRIVYLLAPRIESE